jgi:hypothetical protein
MIMRCLTIIISLVVFSVAHGAELKCSEVMRALKMKRTLNSTGFTASLQVRDLEGLDKAAVKLAQTARWQNKQMDSYEFAITSIKSTDASSPLVTQLDQLTNLQLLRNSKEPRCQLILSSRNGLVQVVKSIHIIQNGIELATSGGDHLGSSLQMIPVVR